MLTYSLEESLDASAEDILEFLERDVRLIHPDKQPHEQPEKMERTINSYGDRKDKLSLSL